MDTEALSVRPSADELLDALGHAVIATDTRGTVLFWNGAAEQLYGWPPDEVVGTPLTNRIHAEDHHVFEELLAADPTAAERVGELRVRAHGAWSWVEVAVTDLYTQPGSQGRVCNIRRSERLARLEERERILEAVHSEVLQDLFAATLALDRALNHTAPSSAELIDAARGVVGRAMETLRDVVRP